MISGYLSFCRNASRFHNTVLHQSQKELFHERFSEGATREEKIFSRFIFKHLVLSVHVTLPGLFPTDKAGTTGTGTGGGSEGHFRLREPRFRRGEGTAAIVQWRPNHQCRGMWPLIVFLTFWLDSCFPRKKGFWLDDILVCPCVPSQSLNIQNTRTGSKPHRAVACLGESRKPVANEWESTLGLMLKTEQTEFWVSVRVFSRSKLCLFRKIFGVKNHRPWLGRKHWGVGLQAAPTRPLQLHG